MSSQKSDKKTPGKDKLSKKKDSPENSESPSRIEVEEPAFKVLDGSDIQALAIKDEDLKKLKREYSLDSEAENSTRREVPPKPVYVKKINKNAYPTVE